MSQNVSVNFHNTESDPVYARADYGATGKNYWLALQNKDARIQVVFYAESAAELYRVAEDLAAKLLAAARTLPLPAPACRSCGSYDATDSGYCPGCQHARDVHGVSGSGAVTLEERTGGVYNENGEKVGRRCE